MSEKVSVYYLEILHPDDGKQLIRLGPETTIGSASNNTVVIKEHELAPRHCVLRVHQDILTLFQVAESGSSKIGRQSLDNGRMYILEKSDKLFLREIKCTVKLEKEKVQEIEEPTEEESEAEIFDEVTDQDIDISELVHKPTFFERLKSKFKKKEVEAEPEEEQNLEDEILDEEEPEKAINNSIYIPKSAVDSEDEEEKPKPKAKKPRYVVNRDDMPAFFARIYAFVAELIIAFAFASNIVPILELGDVFDQIVLDITPLIEKGLSLAAPHLGEHAGALSFLTSPSFLAIALSWIVINLVSNLIFGVNFGLALLFVQTEGSFVTSRLKGFLRLFLSLVLSPLLIFDTPALIKKRTFKEVLTASELSFRHSLLKIVGVLIVLPLICGVFVLAPVLMEPQILEGPQIVEDNSIKDKAPETPQETHPWRALNLTVSYDQTVANEWSFSPFMRGNPSKMSAGANFIRAHNEKVDVVTVGPITTSQINENLIRTIIKLDPFFKSKYPALEKAIQISSFNQDADKDLMALLIDTLKLNWETLPRFISERGPTLYPYIELKKFLMTHLSVQTNTEIKTNLIARRAYLEVAPTNRRMVLHRIRDGRFVSLNLSSKPGAPGAIGKFIRTFFTYSAALAENAASPVATLSLWNVFDFIDQFSPQTKLPLQPESIEALRQLTQRTLALKDAKPELTSIIEADYKKTMNLLNQLQSQPELVWAAQAFEAMNVDQALWQSSDEPSTEDEQEEL
ncbi:MAG: FHA domain-containing protein [bacterium]